MARKKAPLGTTPRRPPALRAASVGFAGAGGRPLVAADVVRRRSREPAAEPTVLQPMNAPARPSERGSRRHRDQAAPAGQPA